MSHASDDSALALEICEWLRSEGHSVFVDRDPEGGIRVGERWKQRLHRELQAADALLCLVTEAFVDSQWCTAEVAIADAAGTTILPLQLSPGLLSPLLDERQHVDLDDHRWRDRLAGALRDIDATTGPRPDDDVAPFPGLRPFDVGLHHYFCGRADELRRLVGELTSLGGRSEGGLSLVVGPSGCGKSSLVRAGLAARLQLDAGWRVVDPFTPGRDPLGALARALTATARRAGLGWTVTQVLDRLDAGDLAGLADDLLLTGDGPPRRYLLLIVDQGEELLAGPGVGTGAGSGSGSGTAAGTPPAGGGERLLELIGAAAGGPVRVVMTLRSEFQDRLLTLPPVAGLPVDLHPLRPLARHMLHVVVDEPARRAGLVVDPELVARLVADTGDGEGLPLLAFTLQRLTDGLQRGDTVSAVRYDEIGGVQGALRSHADAALAEASSVSGMAPAEVLDGLVALAAVGEAGWVRRRVELDRLPDGLRAALGVLVDRRLLVTDHEGAGTRTSVSVAHEALFSEWPPLAAALEERAEALRAAGSLDQATAEWLAGGRAGHFLWDEARLKVTLDALGLPRSLRLPVAGERLGRPASLLDLLEVDIGASHPLVDENAREFLEASRARAQERHRRRQSRRRLQRRVLVTLLAVFVLATAVAVRQWQSAERQQRLAAGRSLLARAESLREHQPGLALQLGTAALDVAPGDASRASLVTTLLGNHYVGTVTRLPPGEEDGVPPPVQAVAFAPDQRTMATGDEDGATLWDVADRTSPRRLSSVGSAAPWALAFSPDQRTLAIGGPGRENVELWDVTDREGPRLLSEVPASPVFAWVTRVSFSRDGTTLLVGEWDNSGSRGDQATLWDIRDRDAPRLLATLAGYTGSVNGVALHPDGRTAATANNSGTVAIWDIADPRAPRLATLLTDHASTAHEVVFSRDGTTMATASADRQVIVYDVTDPRDPRRASTLAGHGARVTGAAFSPDGSLLATASDDGTAALWDVTDVANPTRVDTLAAHPEPVVAIAFSPDGHTVATGSADGTAVLWEAVDTPSPTRHGALVDGDLTGHAPLAVSPDRRTVATGGDGNDALLWDLGPPGGTPRPRAVARLSGHDGPVGSLAFGAGGDTLVTGSADTTAVVWDVSTRARPRPVTRLSAQPAMVHSVGISPDGRTAATSYLDGTALLWDLTDPARLTSHPLRVEPGWWATAVTFSPDGRTLAQGHGDGMLTVWDVTDPADPRELARRDGPSSIYSATFSPDGRILATAEETRRARLWDMSDPSTPRQLATLTGNASTVLAVGFDPTGTILATAGHDKAVILWDVTDPRAPRQLTTLTRELSVGGTTFLRDRDTLAVADEDAVTLWDVSRLTGIVADPAGAACAVTGRGLSRQDWERYAPELDHRPTCPGGPSPRGA